LPHTPGYLENKIIWQNYWQNSVKMVLKSLVENAINFCNINNAVQGGIPMIANKINQRG